MFKRLNETITKTIDNVFRESVCDFSKWWQDDFETEYGFNSEEELRKFSDTDLECVMFDWIYWVLDGFVCSVLKELGFSEDIETRSQEIITEEIHDIVKDKLWRQLYKEWCMKPMKE